MVLIRKPIPHKPAPERLYEVQDVDRAHIHKSHKCKVKCLGAAVDHEKVASQDIGSIPEKCNLRKGT